MTNGKELFESISRRVKGFIGKANQDNSLKCDLPIFDSTIEKSADESAKIDINLITRPKNQGSYTQRTLSTEIAIVGSGPFSLVKGIEYLNNGKSVLLVEKDKYLGGAWAARPCFDEIDLKYDVVAHLISPFHDSYNMLSQAGFKLRERPIYFWEVGAKPERKKQLDQLADHAFDPIITESGQLMGWHQWYALQQWDKGIDAAMETLNSQRKTFLGFKYFENSFQPLVDRLLNKFFSLGGKVIPKCSVRYIDVLNNHVILDSQDYRIKSEIVVTGRHNTADFRFNGESMVEDLLPHHYKSLMLRVHLKERPKHYYINVIGHNRIGAIQIADSNWAYALDQVYYICFIGSYADDADPKSIGAELLNQLVNMKIISDQWEILSADIFSYMSYSHSTSFCTELVKRASGRLDITVVNSIGESMSEDIQLWSKALEIHES